MRVFIALDLPAPLIHDLERLQDRLPPGRRVPAENLHLTLAFLGDQPDAALESVHDALDTLQAAPIEITLGEAAVFGGSWGQAIALRADGGQALQILHDRVLARLRGADIAPERRRFRPHVTLVRLQGRADPTPLLGALTGVRLGPVPCRSFGFYASHLRGSGAEYEELASYPLAALP